MIYTCVIVDDNLLERDDLEQQLRKMPQVQIVGACADSTEAAAMLSSRTIDILFTDIDMPGISGLALIRTLQQRPAIVCISAFPQYAVQGFDLDVQDFITKPASFERLLQSVNKVTEYLRLRAPEPSPAAAPPEADSFFIRETTTLTRLAFAAVAYLESKGDFSKVVTADNKSHLTLVSLKSMEAGLPSHSFIRVHKQYIINWHHITSIENEMITLSHTFQVPLSASYRQELMNRVVDSRLISRR